MSDNPPADAYAFASGTWTRATAAPATMTLHRVVSAFNWNQEEWGDYAKHLENYFITSDIKSSKAENDLA